jgi:glycosyltransferase involved in cell wall biosynthesis
VRILFLTYGAPGTPDRGASVRDRELILRVAKRHHVSVLPVLKSAQHESTDGALNANCEVLPPVVVDERRVAVARRAARHVWCRRPLAALPWITDELLQRVSGAIGDRDFDIVQIEHSLLAPCLEAVPRRCHGVLSLHNVGTFQYRSMGLVAGSAHERALFSLKAWLLLRLESSYAPRFDGVVVVSEDERQLLGRISPGATATVVPNGVDLAAHSPLADDGHPGTLLFVGNLEYPPNAEAVVEFCTTTLPHLRARIPEARLLVVGPGAPTSVRALASEGVEVLGRVDRLEEYYRRAQVVVVPLRAGGGTRLKALEAMAFGRCVVSTPFGVKGLHVTDGREILLAEPGAPFARRVEQALCSAELRATIGKRGRRLVEREHNWDACADRLLGLYAALDGRSPEPRAQ